jgi:hypothetical protein
MSTTKGILLHPLTGRPERDVNLQQVLNLARNSRGEIREGFEAVYDNLRRSAEAEWNRMAGVLNGKVSLPLRNSLQTWEETLSTIVASGTQVSNSSTETILVPDVSLPANFMYQGRSLKYTLFGDSSTVITTPGTIIHRLRWGGVAGTSLCASGAFAPDPTAAATNLGWMVQYYLVCRSIGTAGSMFCMGQINWSDYDDASATTITGNLNMGVAPTSAPAVTSSLDTTTTKALSPTVTHSVATAGTNSQCHIAVLEALT